METTTRRLASCAATSKAAIARTAINFIVLFKLVCFMSAISAAGAPRLNRLIVRDLSKYGACRGGHVVCCWTRQTEWRALRKYSPCHNRVMDFLQGLNPRQREAVEHG